MMLMFHWSPRERRASIQKRGLRPHQESTDKAWRPPYLCFSDSPSLAWALSGDTSRGREHVEWDLWCAWFTVDELVRHSDPNDGRKSLPAEYRYYGDLVTPWYVGTRNTNDLIHATN